MLKNWEMSDANLSSATLVVAASDSLHPERADYQCDGTADDVEIQAALDALPVTGGCVVLLDGTYNIEASLVLDSYQTLRGQGRNTILTTTTTDLDIITATGAGASEKVGILIADLCVDGTAGGDAAHTLILWTFVDESKIRSVWLLNAGGASPTPDGGIMFTTCDYNTIEDVYCASAAVIGVGLTTSTHNTIVGCTIVDNFSNLVLMTNSDDNTITSNTFDGATTGAGIYLMESDGNTISGNVCQGNACGGISFETIAACNNTITGNTCNGNDIGIYLDNSSNNNTVAGNTCNGNTSYGIYLDTSQNTVSGNTCTLNGEEGIRLDGNADHNNICGNNCEANSQTTDNTDSNIRIEGSYNLITSNVCRQGGEANKPRYGISVPGVKNVISSNDLYNAGKTANFLDEGGNTIVRDDNRDITPVQIKHLIYVQNTSGGNLLQGNVVKYNAAAGSVGFTSPTAVGDDGVWGMLREDIANTAWGYIQVLGGTTLLDTTNAGGAIVIGNFLCAENGVRARLAAAGNMVFAIALEDCDAANCVIDALIIKPRKL